MRAELELSYVASDGKVWSGAAGSALSEEPARALPFRRFSSYAGMRHYPGWWWSSTNRDLVGYESLLERDCVVEADFDPEVTRIVSQPFRLSSTRGLAGRHRVPDYLLLDCEGRCTVVDVKPARMLGDPKVAQSLSWTGQALADLGRKYRIWASTGPVRARNLRLVSHVGRHAAADDDTVSACLEAAKQPTTVGALIDVVAGGSGQPASVVRSQVYRLLWIGRLQADLLRPLTGIAEVTGAV
jgi:hypothetical protein